jgi:anti-sigma factor RsiW
MGSILSEEVCIALRCEDFEGCLSAYLDDELGAEETRRFERHMAMCAACSETLRGVYQVRLALRGLGASGLSASFRLRLSTCLQEERLRCQRTWFRPVALSLAFAAALAILLWPEADHKDDLAAYQRSEVREVLDWAPPPLHGGVGAWIEPPSSGPYSHAQARPVSF